MYFVYAFLVLIGAMPLWKTIRQMRREEDVRKKGVPATGTVTNVYVMPRSKYGPATDRVHIRFNAGVGDRWHDASFTSRHRKHVAGEKLPVLFLRDQPDRILVNNQKTYWFGLVFSLLLLLFVFFAIYKIAQMVESGQVVD